MEDILSIIREFGFPVLVCGWFMLRMEKRVDTLSKRIHRLTTVFTVLVKAIDIDSLADEIEEKLETLEDEE